jgi:hypothetical protein
LKSEAEQNQGHAKDPHAFLGHMIGHPFDEGRAGAGDYREHAKGESSSQPDGNRMFRLRSRRFASPPSTIASA